MRGSLPDHIAPDMAKRVSKAVAGLEKLPPAAVADTGSRWRPVAGLAIAASVAVLAIVTLGNPDSSGPGIDASPVTAVAEDSYTVPVINMREQVSAAMRERLNLYQVSHSEFAGPLQRSAILSQMSGDMETQRTEEVSREDVGESQ